VHINKIAFNYLDNFNEAVEEEVEEEEEVEQESVSWRRAL